MSKAAQGLVLRRTFRHAADGLFTSRRRKPGENTAHRKKGLFRMETS